MNKTILIAIPTFNRFDQIVQLLKQLATLDKNVFDLVVIDNHSTDKRYIKELPNVVKNLFPNDQAKLVRNKANLGFSGNFLKCVEYATPYEWLWAIGDDDHLEESFEIASLEKEIKKAGEDTAFITFSSEIGQVSKQLDTTYDSFSSVLENVRFGNILLISTVVYRLPRIAPHLAVGYQFSHSHCPHTAILLRALSSENKLLASSLRPIVWNPSDHRIDEDDALSGKQGISTDVFYLLNVACNFNERKLLYQALVGSYVTIGNVMAEALKTHPESNRMRINWISHFCLNTLLWDCRIASKIGALLAFMLCHSERGLRFFLYLKRHAKKIFPRKVKTKNLRY